VVLSRQLTNKWQNPRQNNIIKMTQKPRQCHNMKSINPDNM
jgi:hypothetical protein